MKISAFQMAIWLFCSGLSLAHDGRAQELLNKSVTIHVEERGLRHVLSTLEKQADVRFVYSSKAIKADRKISVTAKGQRLEEVLKKMLDPLQISYRIVEGQIILNPISTRASAGLKEVSAIAGRPKQSENSMDTGVRGKVTDEKGEGLPGVNVVQKGTQKGTATDVDGNFNFDVTDGSATLVFSFVGYLSQEIPVAGRSTINVTLKVNDKTLEELVVVGYGTAKKKDLTGAVASVNVEDTRLQPNTNATQMLRGTTSGSTGD